jgi:hypothetical protein
MGVASLASTIFDHEPSGLRRSLVLLCLTLLFAGCAAKQVIVEGNFPKPLLEPLPITLGVIYPPAFAEHEFFDEAKGRADSDWLVKTGEAQVHFWDTLFAGMFEQVIHLQSAEALQAHGGEIDGVLIPNIAELQYTIPTHTNVKVYEIWMRYEFRLVDTSAIHQQDDGALTFSPDERLAFWPITAYGKTPTAFLQTDEEAVNLAAVVALRDAGAHFVTTFGATPEVASWLNTIPTRHQRANETPANVADDSVTDSVPEAPAGVLPESSGREERADETVTKTSSVITPPSAQTETDLPSERDASKGGD